MLQTKRIYDDYQDDDGERVLVDRLWPRGVKKEDAKIDQWPKEITPSNDLRKWFHSDEGDFEQFKSAYQEELDASENAQKICKALAKLSDEKTVTLLYASKDEDSNHVRILQPYIIRFKQN